MKHGFKYTVYTDAVHQKDKFAQTFGKKKRIRTCEPVCTEMNATYQYKHMS